MSAKNRRFAYLTAKDTWDVEYDQDRQLASVSTFIATLCNVRIQSQTDAKLGHPALLCAGDALALQLASRSKLIEMHNHLASVAGVLGIKELASGGGGKAPPGTPDGGGFSPGEVPLDTPGSGFARDRSTIQA